MKSRIARFLTLVLPTMMVACAGNPEPPSEPSRVLGIATDSVVEAPIAPPEPAMTLEQRWESPFAVSSAGSIRPASGREIFVLGADSSLAASVALRTGDPLVPESRNARPSTGSDRQPPETSRATTIVVDDVPERRESGRTDDDRDGRGPDAATTHRVEQGESWLGIARRYGMTYSELQRANPAVVPDRLRVGQVLRVERSEPPSTGALTHRVAPGESLFLIARRYNIPIAMLRDVNGLSSDRISPNQVLIIPRSADRD